MNNFVPGWLSHRVTDGRLELEKNNNHYRKLIIQGGAPPAQGRVMLFDVARQVLGKDIENIAQQSGDCVSWGASHVIDLTQVVAMSLGELESYHDIFPPYIYGTSRVQIGGQHDYNDGSVGAWAAQAVMKYGAVACDDVDVPPYSGKLAREWGYSGPPNEFLALGAKHLVKSTAAINSTQDAINALWNRYAITVASSVGFDMTAPTPDGFMNYSTTWEHQMALIGAVWGYPGIPDHFCIMNNWGPDAHGQLVDLVDPTIKWPGGTIRAYRKDVETMISQKDTWTFSQFDGFPALPLDPSLFNIF